MRYQIRKKEVKTVTSNMVGKGKKIMGKEYKSDADDEEPHHFIHLKSGVVAPRNYKKLLKGFCDNDSDNSVITSSHSYISFRPRRLASHMVDKSDDIDQKIEAQEQIIRDQQKAINDLKLILLKMVENTQKIADDKAKTFSEPPPKTNEETKEEKTYSIYEDEDKYSFHDFHEEKIKKLQSQLDALMHKKELKDRRF